MESKLMREGDEFNKSLQKTMMKETSVLESIKRNPKIVYKNGREILLTNVNEKYNELKTITKTFEGDFTADQNLIISETSKKFGTNYVFTLNENVGENVLGDQVTMGMPRVSGVYVVTDDLDCITTIVNLLKDKNVECHTITNDDVSSFKGINLKDAMVFGF